jgi:hypothetical protein
MSNNSFFFFSIGMQMGSCMKEPASLAGAIWHQQMDSEVLHVCLNKSPRVGPCESHMCSALSYNLLLVILKSEIVNEILFTIIP